MKLNRKSFEDNYEDYSSGRVLYGYSGATNFPVRLTVDIFEKCLQRLKERGRKPPYAIYDPLCGVAYSLTVLGFLYPHEINAIYASDNDAKALEFAEKNLGLLSAAGLEARIAEIESHIEKYGKESHRGALKSAHKIRATASLSSIPVRVFRRNALEATALVSPASVDIVICDLPYGRLTQWDGNAVAGANMAQRFLDAAKALMSESSVVVISADKSQEIRHEGYEKFGTLRVPKRKIVFLAPIPRKATG